MDFKAKYELTTPAQFILYGFLFTFVPSYWLAVAEKEKGNEKLSLFNSSFGSSFVWFLPLLVSAISCLVPAICLILLPCAGFSVLCDCCRFSSLTRPPPALQPPLFFLFCKVRGFCHCNEMIQFILSSD